MVEQYKVVFFLQYFDNFKILYLVFLEIGDATKLTCGFLATCLLIHSVVVNFHSVDLNVVSAFDFHPGDLGSWLLPHLDNENKVYCSSNMYYMYMAIYFSIGLWPRTIEITLKSVFKFLIACLAFIISKDKGITCPPSWIFKNQ